MEEEGKMKHRKLTHVILVLSPIEQTDENDQRTKESKSSLRSFLFAVISFQIVCSLVVSNNILMVIAYCRGRPKLEKTNTHKDNFFSVFERIWYFNLT